MSKDLFLGTTKKNWARGVLPTPVVSRPNLTLTADEKSRLEKLAVVKMKAEAGDKKEQAHWKKLRGDLARLVARARRGDKKAARLVAVLEESGLFGQYQQVFAMNGADKKYPNPFGDQAAGPLPRKPNPFAAGKVAALREAAEAGDVSAQVELRKLRIRAAANREEREGISGATEILGPIEILGDFVGDETRARREECGALPFFKGVGRQAHRQRRLARLQRRAAAGDARAQAKLRRIRSRGGLSPYGATPPTTAQPGVNSAFLPAYDPNAPTYPQQYPQYNQPYATPTTTNPYAGLPPLPPDEEYVQDVYV